MSATAVVEELGCRLEQVLDHPLHRAERLLRIGQVGLQVVGYVRAELGNEAISGARTIPAPTPWCRR